MKKLILLMFFLIWSQHAYMSTTRLIENMNWADVKSTLKKKPIILIPIGAGAKEHGLHLPMSNDLIMANYLRDRLLERLHYLLAAPTINYSYYPAFTEYPGSTSLSFDTAKGMIVDISKTLGGQGFKKIYFLNTGISTLSVLKEAKTELAKDGISIDYLDLNQFEEDPVIKNLTQQERGSHADEIETSMMLYMAPQIVDMSKARRDDNLQRTPDNSKLSPDPNTTGTYSPTGAWGDPTLATRDKGKIIVERLVDYLTEKIEYFHK